MSAKVICPLCQHAMTLKSPRLGNYRPQCSKCKAAFSLTITGDDPPRAIARAIQDLLHSPSNTTDKSAQTVASPDRQTTPIKSASPISIPQPITGAIDRTIEREPAEARPKIAEKDGIVRAGKDIKARDGTKVSATIHPRMDITIDENSNTRTALEDPLHQKLTVAATIDSDHSADELDGKNWTEKTAVPPSTSPSSMPDRLGGYRILKVLGEGGMGAVYLAKQMSLDRSVALKTIQAQWAQNPRVIARFIREAYAAAQLTHHNVVQIYDLGEDKGTNFFSMELVNGGSLEDLMKLKGTISPKTASMLILQAARGLKFAHDHGMVHRDVKPANLMLTSDGMLKVADLGLVKTPSALDPLENVITAKEVGSDSSSLRSSKTKAADSNPLIDSARSSVTLQGSTMGTPAFMSPEQAEDAASVDHRADIYSLGCTFYALLTGRPPFVSNSLIEVLSKHKIEKIPRPELTIETIPGVLGDIIERMTAKRPEDRYASLESTIYDLESFLGLIDDDREKVAMNTMPVHSTTIPKNQKTGRTQTDDSQVTSPDLGETVDIQRPLITSNASKTLAPEDVATSASTSSLAGPKRSKSATSTEVTEIRAAANEFDRQPLKHVQLWMPIVTVIVALLLCAFILGISITASLAVFVAVGSGFIASLFCGYFRSNSPIASKMVEYLRGNTLFDFAYQLLAMILLLGIVYACGWTIPIVVAIIIGVGVGVGYYFAVDEVLRLGRVPSVKNIHSIIKKMRLRGLDEFDIRLALFANGGQSRNRLLEELFSFGELQELRSMARANEDKTSEAAVTLIDRLNRLPDSIRSVILKRLDRRIETNRTAAAKRVLAKSERGMLISLGVSQKKASQMAVELAEGIVDEAADTRRSVIDIRSGRLSVEEAQAKRVRIKKMLADARGGKFTQKSIASRSANIALTQLLGGKVRFLCGALLVAGFALWASQNEIFDDSTAAQFRKATEAAIHAAAGNNEVRNDDDKSPTTSDQGRLVSENMGKVAESLYGPLTGQSTKPLAVPIVGHFVNGIATLIAALILIFSSFGGGWRISLVAFPAAAISLIGPSVGIPSLGLWLPAQVIASTFAILFAIGGVWFLSKA